MKVNKRAKQIFFWKKWNVRREISWKEIDKRKVDEGGTEKSSVWRRKVRAVDDDSGCLMIW